MIADDSIAANGWRTRQIQGAQPVDVEQTILTLPWGPRIDVYGSIASPLAGMGDRLRGAELRVYSVTEGHRTAAAAMRIGDLGLQPTRLARAFGQVGNEWQVTLRVPTGTLQLATGETLYLSARRDESIGPGGDVDQHGLGAGAAGIGAAIVLVPQGAVVTRMRVTAILAATIAWGNPVLGPAVPVALGTTWEFYPRGTIVGETAVAIVGLAPQWDIQWSRGELPA